MATHVCRVSPARRLQGRSLPGTGNPPPRYSRRHIAWVALVAGRWINYDPIAPVALGTLAPLWPSALFSRAPLLSGRSRRMQDGAARPLQL